MKNEKDLKILKAYGFAGRFLCTCAGGIVGFILSGPFLAISGIVLGGLSGYLLEKVLLN